MPSELENSVKNKENRPDLEPVALTPEQALRIALNTPLPEKERKRQARKKARAARKK